MELPHQQISRRVVRLPDDNYFALKVALTLWVVTTYWYKKNYFVKNQNMFNWVLFSLGSSYASYQYAYFFLDSPYNTAARENNKEEIQH